MSKLNFKVLLLMFAIAVVFVQCRKKALDEYYGRPDTLEQPDLPDIVGERKF